MTEATPGHDHPESELPDAAQGTVTDDHDTGEALAHADESEDEDGDDADPGR